MLTNHKNHARSPAANLFCFVFHWYLLCLYFCCIGSCIKNAPRIPGARTASFARTVMMSPLILGVEIQLNFPVEQVSYLWMSCVLSRGSLRWITEYSLDQSVYNHNVMFRTPLCQGTRLFLNQCYSLRPWLSTINRSFHNHCISNTLRRKYIGSHTSLHIV